MTRNRRSSTLAGLSFLAALTVGWTGAASAQENGAQQQGAQQNAQAGGTGGDGDCAALPGHDQLVEQLRQVVNQGDVMANGGLANHEWAVTVNRAGVVCAVAHSGEAVGDQWPGSRGIAAAKAFTANGFSLENFALATANLYWPTQPGHMLYGAAAGNPVAASVLYQGPSNQWGTAEDPLVGQRAGGSIVFGGGLPLYDSNGALVGGLGLSGDTSCTDHIIAWKLRDGLNLDNVPGGVAPMGADNIIFDLVVDPQTGQKESDSGYGHPKCDPYSQEIATNLPETHPIGANE